MPYHFKNDYQIFPTAACEGLTNYLTQTPCYSCIIYMIMLMMLYRVLKPMKTRKLQQNGKSLKDHHYL